MKNLQLKYWTSKCIGECGDIIKLGKHLCKALNVSTKGKQPKRYNNLIKIVTDNVGSRSLSQRYYNMNKDWSFKQQRKNIYDKEKKLGKNQLVTWNDDDNNIIFGKYKKKSTSKNFKNIGIHWIIDCMAETDNSSNLVKCAGCEKNIQKKNMDVLKKEISEMKLSDDALQKKVERT